MNEHQPDERFLARIERERKRIIDAIVSRFGLERAQVEDTVRGRSLGVMERQT